MALVGDNEKKVASLFKAFKGTHESLYRIAKMLYYMASSYKVEGVSADYR